MLPQPHPAVLFQDVPDGAILLNPEAEIYFGLNSVGARIWQLLPPVCSDLEQICGALSEAYPEVDPGVLKADVEELLAALQQQALVMPSE